MVGVSKLISASTQIKSTAGILLGLICTGGSDALTVTVRDGTDSGTLIAVIKAAINTTVPVDFFETGFEKLYVTISGTAASVTVSYI